MTERAGAMEQAAVAIGAIRRPHGVKGACKVFSFSGETAHFRNLREVELRRDEVRRTIRVVSVEVHGSTPILFLEGITNPEIARTLSGWEIWVPRDAAAPLTDEEYYITELVGMRVVSEGRPVGEIVAVLDGAQAPLLEIDLGERSTLIPFLKQFVGIPDQATGTVEVLVPWILDTE